VIALSRQVSLAHSTERSLRRKDGRSTKPAEASAPATCSSSLLSSSVLVVMPEVCRRDQTCPGLLSSSHVCPTVMVLSVPVPGRSDAIHYYAYIYVLSACRPLARSSSAAARACTFASDNQTDSSTRSHLLPGTSSVVFPPTLASTSIAFVRKAWLRVCIR